MSANNSFNVEDPSLDQKKSEHSDLLYKTTMCRTFVSQGSCPYGLKCLFAHGQSDLRSVADNEFIVQCGASPKSQDGVNMLIRSNSAFVIRTPEQAKFQLFDSNRSFFPSAYSRLSYSPATQRQNPQTSCGQREVRAFTMFTPGRMGMVISRNPFDRVAPPAAQQQVYVAPQQQQAISPSSQLPALIPPGTNTGAEQRQWPNFTTSMLASSQSQLASAADQLIAEQNAANQDEDRSKKLYKTELCRTFEDMGTCPYGMKCQFAHGEAELRSVERHRKYKTEKCTKFHTNGVCPFGSRCVFIHDEDPRELPNHPLYDPEFAAQRGRERRTSRQSATGLTPRPLNLSPHSVASSPRSATFSRSVVSRSPTTAAGPSSAETFLRQRMKDLKLESPAGASALGALDSSRSKVEDVSPDAGGKPKITIADLSDAIKVASVAGSPVTIAP